MREFAAAVANDAPRYSVHVRGHPPGYLLTLKAMDAVGLSGAWPVVGLSLLATMALPVFVVLAVRSWAGEQQARRAAPFLVLTPSALWMMTSADAVFAALCAAGVACVAAGVGRQGSGGLGAGDRRRCDAGHRTVHDLWRGDVRRAPDARRRRGVASGESRGRRGRRRCGLDRGGDHGGMVGGRFLVVRGCRCHPDRVLGGDRPVPNVDVLRPGEHRRDRDRRRAGHARGSDPAARPLDVGARRRRRAGARRRPRVAVQQGRGRADLVAVLPVAGARLRRAVPQSGPVGGAAVACDPSGHGDRAAGCARLEVVSRRSEAPPSPGACGRSWCDAVAERRGRELAHSAVEVDRRPEPEPARSRVRAGEHVADVAEAIAADHFGRWCVVGLQGAGHLEDRARCAAAHVERPGRGLGVRQREHVGVGHVPHVHEVTLLRSILEDLGRAPGRVRRAEDRRHAGVGRVLGHPRAVDVVVAQRSGGRSRVLARVGRAQVLLGELRRGVHVARIERMILGDGLGRERSTAVRARWLVATRVEILDLPRAGSHESVRRAPVAALAVDDHRRGQDDTAGERAIMQGAQQDGGAEVVAADVRSDVGEVDAEADLGRLMADGIDPGDCCVDRVGVGDAAPDVLGPIVDPRRDPVVRGGVEIVEHDHLVVPVDELVDHM